MPTTHRLVSVVGITLWRCSVLKRGHLQTKTAELGLLKTDNGSVISFVTSSEAWTQRGKKETIY